MKRTIVGLLAAFLMMAGLVGVSSSPATAACPYTGCLKTETTANGPSYIKSNKVIRYSVRVRTTGSNLIPRGRVQLRVNKVGSSTLIISRFYTLDADARFVANLGKLKVGKYNVQFRYLKKPNSRWQNSRSRIRLLRVQAA